MGRIAQVFTLAERYVGAYERYVDATLDRYAQMQHTEDRNATSSERMAGDMQRKIRADEDLGPRIGELTAKLGAMAELLGQLDWDKAFDAMRAALPNGVDPKAGG